MERILWAAAGRAPADAGPVQSPARAPGRRVRPT